MTLPSEAPSLGVVIPAAGAGVRMGGHPKAFIPLGGVPLLGHALSTFLEHPGVRSVVVALSPAEAGEAPSWLRALAPRVRVVPGGETRTLSVFAALESLDAGVDVVLIHDAARPFVTQEIIDRCVAAVSDSEGAVAGWPAADTMAQVDEKGRVVATPDRRTIWSAQTPQAFPYTPLVAAYRHAVSEGRSATDDAQIFRGHGGSVRMVEGARWNLKVTHPEDLELAELLVGRVDSGAEGRERGTSLLG